MLTNPTFIDFTNAAKSLKIEPPPPAIKLQEGIYISSFPHNYNHTITNKHNNNPPLYEYYPWSTLPSYGVCDNYQQILKEYPELEADKERHYTIGLTPVMKEHEPPNGGWRWHKWGPYIGTQESKAEYLYDEPTITLIYTYTIIELKDIT